MNVYILLDRSGSMSSLWAEAIGSVNGYVSKLKPLTKVNFAAFDSVSYDVVRDCKVKDWVEVSPTELTARGSTPLFDACGKMMALAESENAKKTILVVMTDGYENASKEYSQAAIQAKVKEFEDKKWEVIFLGANLDSVESVSGSVGVAANKTMNYGAGQFMRGMETLATSSMAYQSTGASIVFDDATKNSITSSTV
jgi:uncharacterized protein YegL